MKHEHTNYRVWCQSESEEEASVPILATSSSDAACKWAMKTDMEHGYPTPENMPYIVCVRDIDVQMFEVSSKCDLVSQTSESLEIEEVHTNLSSVFESLKMDKV
jgi:hypothetical protein